MSEQSEAIWQRSDAKEIMRKARNLFYTNGYWDRRPSSLSDVDDVEYFVPSASAHVGLASAHYSLVKRYMSPAPIRFRWLALWHMWRAVVNVEMADELGLENYDQIDVAATILRRAPMWMGGSPHIARAMIEDALKGSFIQGTVMMQPHTRALLLIGLGECELKMGWDQGQVASRYDKALALENEILAEEDKVMAQRQWVRILFACSVFYLDQADRDLRLKGRVLIKWARDLARQVSEDQVHKIEAECAKRGL